MDNNIATNDILLFMTVGIGVMLLLTIIFVLFFHYSQKKLQNEKFKNQQLQIAHQNQLLNASILSQEKERKRIAKDLHDGIGSKLNVILLSLHRVNNLVSDLPKVATTIQDSLNLLNNTVGRTRRIAHGLLPPTLESFGLVTAIEELCDDYRRTQTLAVNFELVANESIVLDKTVELHLFRVLQELFLNSTKHGQATQIAIFLNQATSSIQLTYQDNGNGFDKDEFKEKKGLGMQNIESRLKLINAQWKLFSAIGEGVKVTISYSFNQKN